MDEKVKDAPKKLLLDGSLENQEEYTESVLREILGDLYSNQEVTD